MAVNNNTYSYTPSNRGIFTPDNTAKPIKYPINVPKTSLRVIQINRKAGEKK